MLNKKIILIVGGIIVLVLAFFFLTQNKTTTTNETTDLTTTQQTTQENTTVFDSIKDAMSKSLSLKCEYVAGGGSVVAYIKGNSIRMDNLNGNNNSGNAIIKDNRLWTWSNQTNEGAVMTLPKPEEGKQTSSEEIINNLEEQKQFCTPAVVSDSAFEPPANIKFQDLTKMMEQITGFIPAE